MWLEMENFRIHKKLIKIRDNIIPTWANDICVHIKIIRFERF